MYISFSSYLHSQIRSMKEHETYLSFVVICQNIT